MQFNGITPNRPTVHWHSLALIMKALLATVFSMAWYTIVTRPFSWYTVEYPTRQLYFLSMHTRVYSKKIQVTSQIFHGMPLERVAYHNA